MHKSAPTRKPRAITTKKTSTTKSPVHKINIKKTSTDLRTKRRYSLRTAFPQPDILANSSGRLVSPFHPKSNMGRKFSSAVNQPVTFTPPPPPKSLLHKLGLSSAADITLSPEASAAFNRNKIIPAALLTHLSLGSVFAWSLFNPPLMLANGVIEQAASDWTLSQVMPTFSVTMSTFGCMSFLSGRKGINEKYGPRITSLMGAGLFAGGFSLSALAASTHTLPLLYLGYGLMAGSAVGVSYVGPVATLMKWFPDRRGLASSLGIVGFGAAAIFAAQFIEKFVNTFKKLPQRIGDATQFPTQIIDGRLMASIDGVQQEVVIATSSSLKKLGKVGETLQEGMYLVGSGDVGISNTFLALGAIYTIAIGCAAFLFKLPHERYDPTLPGKLKPLPPDVEKTMQKVQKVAAGATDTSKTESSTKDTKDAKELSAVVPSKPKFDYIATAGDLKPGNVLKTKQYWFLWTGLLCNSAAAYAVIGSAKNLMLDVYGIGYPMLVTSAFAATFVSMISAFNLSGRLGWGAVSDKIGRRHAFNLMWGLSIPFYLGIPFASSLLQQGVDLQSTMMPLAVFYGSVCCAIACFGGSAAISPAYIADLYGSKYSAANAGQLLSYLMVSGYLGPLTVTTLREMSTRQAIEDLTSKVDIGTFTAKFGATPDRLNELIAAKAISIDKLMEVVPAGTPDPTPYLYNTIFITMASLQFIALMCNQGVTKIPDSKFHEQQAQDDADAAAKQAKAIAASPELTQVRENLTKDQATREAELLQKIAQDTITDAKPLLNEHQTEALKAEINKAGETIKETKEAAAAVAKQ